MPKLMPQFISYFFNIQEKYKRCYFCKWQLFGNYSDLTSITNFNTWRFVLLANIIDNNSHQRKKNYLVGATPLSPTCTKLWQKVISFPSIYFNTWVPILSQTLCKTQMSQIVTFIQVHWIRVLGWAHFFKLFEQGPQFPELFTEVTFLLLFKNSHQIWGIMSKHPANVFFSSFWYNKITVVAAIIITSTIQKLCHNYLSLACHLTLILLPLKYKKNLGVGIFEWSVLYSSFCLKISKSRSNNAICDGSPCKICEKHICLRNMSSDNDEIIFQWMN